MMGNVKQDDKLDAGGLTTLLRLGSLPSVWLPPADLRDQARASPHPAWPCAPGAPESRTAFTPLWPSTLCPRGWIDAVLATRQSLAGHRVGSLPLRLEACLTQELQLLIPQRADQPVGGSHRAQISLPTRYHAAAEELPESGGHAAPSSWKRMSRHRSAASFFPPAVLQATQAQLPASALAGQDALRQDAYRKATST